MADFFDVPSLTGRPGPSVEEILNRETRPAPAALREDQVSESDCLRSEDWHDASNN